MKKNLCKLLILLVVLLAFCGCGNNGDNSETPDEDHDAVQDDEETDDDISDEDVTQEAVYDVKIAENEKNSLSCRLTFSTAEERKTFVKYYSPKHAGYKIAEDSAKTEHYFFLWGMRENNDYKIEIYSDEEDPELLAAAEFHSGKAPDYLPFTYLGEHDLEKTQQGFVLFQYAATDLEHVFPIALMVDTDGMVVWYFEYDSGSVSAINDVSWNPETQTILMGLNKDYSGREIPEEEAIEVDLEGNIVWKSPEIMSYYYDPNSWHHAYYKLSDGSVAFPQAVYDGCVVTDRIMNLDGETYEELWSWDYRDSYELPDCTGRVDGDWIDWTHTNSITMYPKAKIAYVNSRNFSTFFKIDMNDGHIVWKLGKDGDFTFVGENDYPWFEFAHDPEINGLNGDKIIFYDNGPLERGFSRIVEYTIDEAAMTAEISFEFDGSELDKSWLAEYWGDADRLENGNIFVTAGLYDMFQVSRFFEVTRDGEIVWELFFEKNDDWQVSLYKADKFMPPLEFLF